MKLPVNPAVRDRVSQLEIPFNRYGMDQYGCSKEHLSAFFSLLTMLYRHYLDVTVVGVENVPDRGRAMLVCNHSGGIALDAGMILTSLIQEKEPPRLAHAMAEKFMYRVPFAAPWLARVGQLTGLPEHAIRLLEDERLLLVFPEGAKGTAKLYWDRYSLVRFGTGFLRLALHTHSPIIPIAFIGGGEAIPTVFNNELLGKLFGSPYVPMTPYLLPVPLPARCKIIFGEPLSFEGSGNESDEIIGDMVEQVKGSIASLIEEGKEGYSSPVWPLSTMSSITGIGRRES